MNAYTHGLRSSLHFGEDVQGDAKSDAGDGALEMVLFTLRYLEMMEKEQNTYYEKRIFGNVELKAILTELIREAIKYTRLSCGRPNLHLNNKPSIQGLRSTGSLRQLKRIFGEEVPSVGTECEKNAEVHDSGVAVSTDFEKDDQLFRRQKEIRGHKSQEKPVIGKQVSSDYTIVRYELPEFPVSDPNKPSIDAYVERIDATHFRVTMIYANNQIESVMGPNEAESYSANR